MLNILHQALELLFCLLDLWFCKLDILDIVQRSMYIDELNLKNLGHKNHKRKRKRSNEAKQFGQSKWTGYLYCTTCAKIQRYWFETSNAFDLFLNMRFPPSSCSSLNARRIKSWFPQTWVSHTLSQHLSSKFAPNCCLQKMNQSINVHCMSHCCKLMWKSQRNFFERSSDVFKKVWIPICCVMCMPGDRSSNSSWNLSIVEVCGPFVYTHFFHTTDYHTFVDSLKLIRFTLCKRLQILFTRPG